MTVHLRYRLSVLIAICCFALNAHAQYYPFSNYTVEDGLANSQILAIEQDNDGVMWLGTNNGGITRFDGNSFEQITSKDSLAHDVVFDIEKDAEGNMWVGTNDGLSIYRNGTIENYRAAEGLTHSRVFDVVFHEGETWLATGLGVTRYKDGAFVPFDVDSLVSNSAIVKINFDSEGNIWLSTLGNGLLHYDGTTVRQYTYNNTPKELISQYVYGVCEIGPNHRWVLTHRGVVDWRGDSLSRVDFEGLEGESFFCYNFERDQEGSIWIATAKGIFKYRKEQFTRFSTKNGLVNDNMYCLLQDREGNMWFGSRENGVSRLSSERLFVIDDRDGLPDVSVQAVFENDDNEFWLGTKKGAILLRDDRVVDHVVPAENQSGQEIWSIAKTEDGTVWFGTNIGLCIYKEGTIQKYVLNTLDVSLRFIYDIHIDTDGRMLTAGKGGLGMIRNDSVVDMNGHFGFPREPVFEIHQDSYGNHWFAAESGLYRHDGNSLYHFSEADGFVTEKVRTLVEDERENLWIATSSGIYRRNKSGVFSVISDQDGLSSNIIYSLQFDHRGNLWAGVTNGLDQVVFKGNDVMKIIEVRHFSPEDGFMGQVCNNKAILKDQEDRILVGTIKGLMVYQPEYDRKNDMEPLTRLRQVRLFSLETDWSEYADSVSLTNIPLGLELPYNKNYFAFDFVGVSHTAPQKVRYQYMLEGLDQNWLSATDKTEAVYSNLPFGSYTFLVKASNGEGVWNETPVSFSFVVHPPFWRTWWFYTLCFVAFCIAVWSYLRIRNANYQITQQNNEIILQRDEIQKAKDVIEEKNNDIMDSIRYAQRIQEAILPSQELLNSHLPDSFIMYRPKDIVSGDFYWVQEKDNKILFAAVDCTGHGVPGAFVSIVGHNHLNEAIKQAGYIKPGNILRYLNEAVDKTLHQKYETTSVRDGMDLALCSLDREGGRLEYAGANNPLYIIRDGELMETKATKRAIGSDYAAEDQMEFVNHEFDVQSGDCVYVFSDGYADQFGGPKGKKFKYKQFKDFLVEIHQKPMKEQLTLLQDRLTSWMGDIEQIDDICVIGVRV